MRYVWKVGLVAALVVAATEWNPASAQQCGCCPPPVVRYRVRRCGPIRRLLGKCCILRPAPCCPAPCPLAVVAPPPIAVGVPAPVPAPVPAAGPPVFPGSGTAFPPAPTPVPVPGAVGSSYRQPPLTPPLPPAPVRLDRIVSFPRGGY
jgi:hypothetical protein